MVKHPWRLAGYIGGGLTLLAFLQSYWMVQRPKTPRPPTQVSGFGHSIAGLGRVQTIVEGRVTLRREERRKRPDGSIFFQPALMVQGRDPIPAEDNTMQLPEAVVVGYRPVVSPDQTASVTIAYRLEAPRGWIPLDPNVNTLTVDLQRPMRLEQPVIHMPGFLGNRDAIVESAEVLIDYPEQKIFGSGPFVLRSEGLVLEGHDLVIDLERNSLAFGIENGALNWSIVDPGGIEYRGTSDSGGSLVSSGTSNAKEVQVLTLPAHEVCQLFLPEESGRPGVLHTGGMRFFMERTKTGWRPTRAEGLNHSRWVSQTDYVYGKASTVTWRSNGAVQGVHLWGPLHGVSKQEDAAEFVRTGTNRSSLHWFAARGGAFFEPRVSGLYLYDRAYMQGSHIGVTAGFFQSRRERVEAGGEVFFQTPQANGTCSRLIPESETSWQLLGRSVVYPVTGPAQHLSAPEIKFNRNGTTFLKNGFYVNGKRREQDWRLRGDELQIQEDRVLGLRVEADGDLDMTLGNTRFWGETLRAFGEESSELRGRPARAEMELADGVLQAEARRFVTEEDLLMLVGKPRLTIPAQLFALEGEETLLTAGHIQRNNSTEEWELRRNVVFTGALKGSADKVTWRPQEGMTLVSPEERVRLSGRPLRAPAFDLAANTLSIQTDGRVSLEGRSEADFELFASAEALQTELPKNPLGLAHRMKLQGNRGELDEQGGWFERDAVLTSGALKGTCDRLEWRILDQNQALASGQAELKLLGRASLKSSLGSASGDEIHFLPETSILRIVGNPDKLAHIVLADGREAWAEWLEIDLVHLLISSGKGHIVFQQP